VIDQARQRQRMVERHLAARDIDDPRVLSAMGEVPRERFLPPAQSAVAYADRPLPIGKGQTISQPYIVAYMIQAVRPRPMDRALEIGTGSGYAAAVLSRIVTEVYTVELHPELARRATQRLAELGYDNVHVRVGDGSLGWPEHAPYDAILVTAAGPRVPDALTDQLGPDGRLVMPVGRDGWTQRLLRVQRARPDAEEEARRRGAFVTEDLGGVAFVPLIGHEGW
jgi:protein-L-isoaspartate(D-aspartate) O-methyltransferase